MAALSESEPVLIQTQPDGCDRPVAAERRYNQTEREALAVLFGAEHFHFFLYKKQFVIITDDKPLLRILSSRSYLHRELKDG